MLRRGFEWAGDGWNIDPRAEEDEEDKEDTARWKGMGRKLAGIGDND